MAGSVNTIARIVDEQVFQNVTSKNVYHYLLNATDANPDLGELASGFITTVLDEVRDVQSDNLVHTTMTVTTVNRGSSEHISTLNSAGTRATTNDAPTWVAAGIKLNRSDTSTRNGYKRIGGLDESDFTGNDLSAAGLLLFADVIIPMLTTITTVDGDWRPVILGKLIDAPTGNYFSNFLSGGSVMPQLRGQDTRKD